MGKVVTHRSPRRWKLKDRFKPASRHKVQDVYRKELAKSARQAIKEASLHIDQVPHGLLDDDSGRKTLAINLMSDFLQSFSMRQIARMVGVSEPALRQWRHDPLFRRALDDKISQNRDLLRLEAFKGWARAIRAGDTKVIEKYLKMTGDIKDETVNINVNDFSKMSDQELDTAIGDMEKQLANDRARH